MSADEGETTTNDGKDAEDTMSQEEDDSDDPDVPELPIMLAVTEVIEYIFLSRLQFGEGRPCKHELVVSVKTLDPTSDDPDSKPSWFQVAVKFSCEAPVETDIFNYLQNHGDSVRTVAKYSQELEDKSHLYVETNLFGGGHLKVDKNKDFQISEHIENVEMEDEPNMRLLAKFRVFQSRSHMLKECQLILQYLRKVRVLNPDISLKFLVDIFGVTSTSSLAPLAPCVRVASKRIVVNPKHFISREVFQYKAPLKSSGDYVIPTLRLEKKIIPDTKLYVLAMIMPPVQVVPASCDKCNKIQMLFYGPGGIPLIVPHVSLGDSDLSSLIRLSEYGAKVATQAQSEEPSDPDVISPDFMFHVCPEELNDDQTQSTSCIHGDHLLQLIFLFDKAKDEQFTTEKYIGFIDMLRQNLGTILSLRKVKIQKPLHVAVDKLLVKKTPAQDRGIPLQKGKILRKAIPTISTSICTILTQSVNKPFRSECYGMMKVNNTRAMKRELHKRLWTIASRVHGVATNDAPPEDGGQPTPSSSREEASQESQQTQTQEPSSQTLSHQTQTRKPSSQTKEDSVRSREPEKVFDGLLDTKQSSPSGLNFDALGTAVIQDEETMFQDDMGGIEDIEMAEQILLDEVRQLTGTQQAEKLEATIDDSWFNDLIDDADFLL